MTATSSSILIYHIFSTGREICPFLYVNSLAKFISFLKMKYFSAKNIFLYI